MSYREKEDLKNTVKPGWWGRPVIPATLKAEVEDLELKTIPGNVSEILCQNKIQTKELGVIPNKASFLTIMG
jgi:hypothetical protein